MEAISADAVLIATEDVANWGENHEPIRCYWRRLSDGVRAGAVRTWHFSIPPNSSNGDNKKPFLITEALRGEGGVLLDSKD